MKLDELLFISLTLNGENLENDSKSIFLKNRIKARKNILQDHTDEPLKISIASCSKFKLEDTGVNLFNSSNAIANIQNALKNIATRLDASDAELSEGHLVKIILAGHGGVIGGEHLIGYQDVEYLYPEQKAPTFPQGTQATVLEEDMWHTNMVRTEDIFKEITKFLPNCKVEIFIDSCHGGMAQKYVDSLPTGSTLYSIATEEFPTVLKPIHLALEQYPSDEDYNIHKFIDLILFTTIPSEDRRGREDMMDTPVRMIIGTSGEGSYIYTIDPFSLKNRDLRSIAQIKEFLGSETESKYAERMKFLTGIEREIAQISEDSELEHLAETISDNKLTKLAMILDSKQPFFPSVQLVSVPGTKLFPPNSLQSFFYSEFDQTRIKIVDLFYQQQDNLLEELEPEKIDQLSSNGMHPDELYVASSKDQSGNRFLKLGAIFNNTKSHKVTIHLSEGELLSLLSDDSFSLYELLKSKAIYRWSKIVNIF